MRVLLYSESPRVADKTSLPDDRPSLVTTYTALLSTL